MIPLLDSTLDPSTFRLIDAYVTSQMQAMHIPGVALGIVQGDKIVHLQGFGVANPAGQPMTAHTPLVLGSTSKSFTAQAIMQLVEAGKISLDAPVQRYHASATTSARVVGRSKLGRPRLGRSWSPSQPAAMNRVRQR